MNLAQSLKIGKILSTYGQNDQIAQTVEELLELAVLLQKYRRKSKRSETLNIEICSELADVKIMIEQMLLIFDQPTINWNIDFKLNREIDRISKLQ
jgi:hypothetical protein